MYVVGGSLGYYKPWASMFSMTPNVEEAHCLLFTGGEDIDPSWYGEKNRSSHPNKARDDREVPYFRWAVAKNKPMIGICRGAQLFTALTGGKLYQHVTGHARGGGHMMQTSDGRQLPVSSLHHQMCRPAGKYELLAWSEHLSDGYPTEEDVDNAVPECAKGDPEVFWIPKVKALCIQGHPEFMDTNCKTNKYFRELADQYIVRAIERIDA